ncbi:GAF domain-containing sensor histidine kinase [Massilia glaciei]|uniref:histidine kinase n=1 Tax=Massilia glaciei TaxID=1524097 RepID=A0A2U2HNE9_9BURK|nr:GAF domain-containing sensor histidine kinase [Massilia glaciei]PWF49030.1 histidine kinase [Massilia glaciei]
MDALNSDVQAIQAISSVPTILRVVAETTGLRFVCIARVTGNAWVTCAALDRLGLGLRPGDELDVATTLCDSVRAGDQPIVIDHASVDPVYCTHPTPRQYGFESYIAVPVRRANGDFFGTLCGLDPEPAALSDRRIVDTLTLLAELVSRQLEDEQRIGASEAALLSERANSELREQFIAVLGHDLRTPLLSILTGAELLRRLPLEPHALSIVERIKRSGRRMASLVDDVVDFTRGRMGGGIPLDAVETTELGQQLLHVVAELKDVHGGRVIDSEIDLNTTVYCDPKRIAQMLSNLLVNALTHGAPDHPVTVRARSDDGALFLSVSNAGAPIADETLQQLFQPFWRGSNSGPSEGLGLGLYIASEIARSHGGSLIVTSTGEATTFSFTAPRIAR